MVPCAPLGMTSEHRTKSNIEHFQVLPQNRKNSTFLSICYVQTELINCTVQKYSSWGIQICLYLLKISNIYVSIHPAIIMLLNDNHDLIIEDLVVNLVWYHDK